MDLTQHMYTLGGQRNMNYWEQPGFWKSSSISLVHWWSFLQICTLLWKQMIFVDSSPIIRMLVY